MIWTGWSRRREAQWHKRAMLSAAILVVMGPAIGRMPIAPPTLGGFTFQLLLGMLLFVPVDPLGPAQPGPGPSRDLAGHRHGSGLGAVPLLIFWTGADWASVARQLAGHLATSRAAFGPNCASP